MVDIVRKSRELMEKQTERNKAPSWLLTEMAIERGRELSKKYNVDEKAKEFDNIMNKLGIKDYRIDMPKPVGSENVNYGIWIEFHKF